MSKTLEHDIQAAYFDWVAMMANVDPRYLNIFAVPNGGRRSFGALNYYKREGLKAGVPDIVVAWPCGGFPGMFIETKRPGEELRKEQRVWRDRLLRAGYYWVLAFAFEEMKKATERYMRALIEPVTITPKTGAAKS